MALRRVALQRLGAPAEDALLGCVTFSTRLMSRCIGSVAASPGDNHPTLDDPSVPSEEADAVVIGCGVVGLACARALALAGREVLMVERAKAIGTETSARHSEVIHAGIYYPTGSAKARLCVQGKHQLYDYCAERGIAHRRLGKLIVATSAEQVGELRALQAQARRNGVPDLQMLGREEAVALEPALSCVAAVLSPSTGILDSHRYMEALLADAQSHGATLALQTEVVAGLADAAQGPVQVPGPASAGGDSPAAAAAGASARSVGSGEVHGRSKAAPSASTSPPPRHALLLRDHHGGTYMRIIARSVINAAGLWSQHAARRVAGLPPGSIPRQYLARGVYFSLAGRSPFSRLLYPVPEKGLGGLGTHLTLDLAGRAKFGPDVEWVDTIHYTVDPGRAASFYPSIRRYYPALQDGALQPAYAGVRPKLSGPGQPAADFVIQGRDAHGVRGWVNLYGIESPGLTSSMAIADEVVRALGG